MIDICGIKPVILIATTLALFSSIGLATAQSNASTARSTGRIIQGTPTDPGDAPWTVSIRIDDQHACGGSLISPDWNRTKTDFFGWRSDDRAPVWVVTAAHCVLIDGYEIPKESFSVRSGARDLSSGEGIFHSVEAILYHYDFDEFSLNNDIALLKISEPTDDLPLLARSSIRMPLLQEFIYYEYWTCRVLVPPQVLV